MRQDIFKAKIFQGLTPEECLRLLSESFHYTMQTQDSVRICDEPNCGKTVARGPRCEPHKKTRHNAFERARYERRKAERAAGSPSLPGLEPLPESRAS